MMILAMQLTQGVPLAHSPWEAIAVCAFMALQAWGLYLGYKNSNKMDQVHDVVNSHAAAATTAAQVASDVARNLATKTASAEIEAAYNRGLAEGHKDTAEAAEHAFRHGLEAKAIVKAEIDGTPGTPGNAISTESML